MVKHTRTAIVAVAAFFLVPRIALAGILEAPTRPGVDTPFDATKEAKIGELTSLNVREAFARLRSPEFLVNEAFLHKGIFVAFGHRRKEAIALALDYVKSPRVEMTGDKRVSRANDFQVAKMILQVFPDESAPVLVSLHGDRDPMVRADVIRVLGKLAGGQAVKEVLVKALDDKALYEKESPEMEGEPLRVCDLAYNQLVLRYKIKNVLRTIGTGHGIETREYHIGVLKKILSES